jgi:pimeloyl-ACP methyl ester carboxylesterase
MITIDKSDELFVTVPSGCKICYQTFGRASDPPIVALQGWGVSMTGTTEELLHLLSPPTDPHFVIRFDHRDTGRSTSFPQPAYGERAYTIDDMADDVVGLVRHLKLDRVHLVGMSFGGPISWVAAAKMPDLIASLTLMVTSPVGRRQDPTDQLGETQEGSMILAEKWDPPFDENDHEGWIKMLTEVDLALATQPPTEEEKAESRRNIEASYYRERETGTFYSKQNHSDASLVRWPREKLKEIKCPTLVLRAEKDQIFTPDHSEALRDDVEGATLVVIPDCGHEMPKRARPIIAHAILDIVAKGEKYRGR